MNFDEKVNNKPCQEGQKELGDLNNTKVVLENIKIFLNKSQRFCTYCLILFPDKSSFYYHEVMYHRGKVCINKSNKNKLKISQNNDFPTYNHMISSIDKKYTNAIRNEEPKLPSKTLFKTCIHCDNLFSEKALIDHLYEVLNAKKRGNVESCQSSVKSAMPITIKQTFISNLKNTEFKKDIIITKTNTHINANFNMSFYFCNTCKCYIPQGGRVDVHLQSICKSFIKCTCRYCGLTLPKIAMNLHQEIHFKYSDLSLQDFKFYDLKTKSAIKPCQVLPKCNTCEIYFIQKSELISHICKKEENLQCPICGIKLSVTAHKLHLPFHSYSLENNAHSSTKKETVNSNLENEIDVDVVEGESIKLNESTDSDLNYINLSAIYTCKNCGISMNEYDEVINHCQLHNNLNDLRLNSTECVLCNLKFLSSTYKTHQDLHVSFTKDQFKQFNFDILHFGSTNDDWLKYLFGNEKLKSCINKYIRNSIYKDECRFKLDIFQEGPVHLTIYKCGKCESIFDAPSIYQHMEECCTYVKKMFCKYCNLSFINKISMNKHENIHNNFNIDSNSFRIVIFNKKEHEGVNIQIANAKKYYILYQCRFCHVVVDYNTYENHKCHPNDYKKCSKCGLLIEDAEYSLHMDKHINLNSFNTNFIYVILLGQNNRQIINKEEIGIVPTFNGMISDYTFYKCAQCEVCLRDRRNIIDHYCLIKAAKLECPKCDLIFEEGKLKGHLKLHDNDPYFTKDTIMIKIFDMKGFSDNMTNSVSGEISNTQVMLNNSHSIIWRSALGIVKIYKCACGLHFLNRVTLTEHSRGCCGKIKSKQSKQNCLKCGLTFSPDILFKHLLKHHKGKNAVFKYEIIKI